MELWDLYDKNRNKLNKVAKRGDYLKDDEFHLVVNAWIINKNGEFLITQRNEYKSHPLMWETTGGSVNLGEDSITGALREVKEELGIDLDISNAKLIGSTTRYYEGCPDILDVWLFESNVLLDEITIQKEEVNDVMWASKEKILELFNNKKFEANAFFMDAINFNQK